MSQPEKSFRIGACSASVFVNTRKRDDDGSERSFRTVTLQRRYRDGNEWKNANNFTLADLPSAIAVMEMAFRYMADEEGTFT